MIREGIPRFVDTVCDEDQAQVQDCFSFKWNKTEWGFNPHHIEVTRGFFFDRFGFAEEKEVEEIFREKTALHAGIGSGQAEQYYLYCCKEVWGIDISTSVDACRRNWSTLYPALSDRLHLVQADLMAMPFRDESFDLVLSDGVLHHTPDTSKALAAITRKAKPGGLVMFYVYKKKGPMREFVDDYIRKQISGLSPEQAWTALEPLTELARDLSQAQIRINVPRSSKLLGLKAGEYDLQRWLYWNVLKLFWNDGLDFDDNNLVNFDWYYPKYAWRHSPDEVRGWLDYLNLAPMTFHVSDSGIGVIGKRSLSATDNKG